MKHARFSSFQSNDIRDSRVITESDSHRIPTTCLKSGVCARLFGQEGWREITLLGMENTSGWIAGSPSENHMEGVRKVGAGRVTNRIWVESRRERRAYPLGSVRSEQRRVGPNSPSPSGPKSFFPGAVSLARHVPQRVCSSLGSLPPIKNFFGVTRAHFSDSLLG